MKKLNNFLTNCICYRRPRLKLNYILHVFFLGISAAICGIAGFLLLRVAVPRLLTWADASIEITQSTNMLILGVLIYYVIHRLLED